MLCWFIAGSVIDGVKYPSDSTRVPGLEGFDRWAVGSSYQVNLGCCQLPQRPKVCLP